MLARLIEDSERQIKLLCANGSISIPGAAGLAHFLINFKDAKSFNGDEGKWNEEYHDISEYPGKTLAFVSENNSLVIYDAYPFEHFINKKYFKEAESYISLSEYAEKHNKSTEIIKVLCRQGRIIGARKIGGRWAIPQDAPYPIAPENQRVGSGRTRSIKSISEK